MSPSELLATVVLGSRAAALAAIADVDARDLGGSIVRLAAVWRLVPALRRRLRTLGAELEGAAARELAGYSTAGAVQSALICRRTCEALAALSAAGIRAAAFKGVAAIADLHGEPAARMVADADVLIDDDALSPVLRALAPLGFKPEHEVDLDSWFELLDERVWPAHDFLVVIDRDAVSIDLHLQIGTPGPRPLTNRDLLARARRVDLGGRSLPVVADEDAILLTTHHTIREHFAPQTAVKDLVDLAARLEASDRWDVEVLTGRALGCGLARGLLAAWMILDRMNPDGSAKDALRVLASRLDQSERAGANALAELFLVQLRDGPVSEGVLGLSSLSPPTVGRFVLSRLHSWTSRDYKERKFAVPDLPLWPRTRQLMRDLARLSPRRFVLYRAAGREMRRLSGARSRKSRTGGGRGR